MRKLSPSHRNKLPKLVSQSLVAFSNMVWNTGSSSPGELEPVFQTMLENATRLCETNLGNLFLCEGDNFRIVAQHTPPSGYAEVWRREPVLSVRDNPGTVLARLVSTK